MHPATGAIQKLVHLPFRKIKNNGRPNNRVIT